MSYTKLLKEDVMKKMLLLILACAAVFAGCNNPTAKNDVTVHFDANQGVGTMQSETLSKGGSFTVPSNGFTRGGYLFSNWNTSTDTSGTSYKAGDVIPSLTSDLTLHAIWTLNPIIKFISFDEGLTLEQLFDTVVDSSATLSIQHTIAKSGYALRCNLKDVHRLDVKFDETAGYQDFWVMFDYYLESTDTFRANTYVPLILVCDSKSVVDANSATPKLIGTPLYNDESRKNMVGFGSIKPLTNIDEAGTKTDSIKNRIIIKEPVSDPMGRWHNIKYHVKMDNSTAGIDLYIDNELRLQAIQLGDAPESVRFDLLRIWYHVDEDTGNVQAAPDTNIYLDNIGIYREDPDLQ
jgi:hypothetical protein